MQNRPISEKIAHLRQLIDIDAKAVISECDRLLDKNSFDEQVHHLRANAAMKLGIWDEAIRSCLKAEAVNPNSPARETRMLIESILSFRNTDMINP